MASPRLAKGDTLLLPTILRGCLVHLTARTMYATINELSQDCIVLFREDGFQKGRKPRGRETTLSTFSRQDPKGEPLPFANYCAIKL